jgi:hypothetical protein
VMDAEKFLKFFEGWETFSQWFQRDYQRFFLINK